MSANTLIGRQLDEYHLEKLLGQGGMARVYLAMDVRLNRHVAIKVIDMPSHVAPKVVARFEREAQAVARLEHPQIVRLYRYGEVDGLLYMAMQYIEGSNLRAVLASYHQADKLIEPRKASHLTLQICSALDYAHSQGVIHRDVKPSNILLDQQGRAFLADFGLARLLDVATKGEVFGSAHYMAPEQGVSSAASVPQTDLYAMGVILYEMFTGHRPFDADNPAGVVMQHISEPPPPLSQWRPHINERLEEVVLKALAKRPEDRFQTGADLADALERALQVTYSRPPSGLYDLARAADPDNTESTAPALPPVPAAVVVPPDTAPPDFVSVELSSTVEAARGRKRRLRVYLASIIGLITMVLLAYVFVIGDYRTDNGSQDAVVKNDGTPVGQGVGSNNTPSSQDRDADGVPNAEDGCPNQAGLPETGGCLYTGTVLTTTNQYANLRARPSMFSTVLGFVPPGRQVTLLGRNQIGNWLWVRTLNQKDFKDIDAWIATDLIKNDDGTSVKVEPLPVVDETGVP